MFNTQIMFFTSFSLASLLLYVKSRSSAWQLDLSFSSLWWIDRGFLRLGVNFYCICSSKEFTAVVKDARHGTSRCYTNFPAELCECISVLIYNTPAILDLDLSCAGPERSYLILWLCDSGKQPLRTKQIPQKSFTCLISQFYDQIQIMQKLIGIVMSQ